MFQSVGMAKDVSFTQVCSFGATSSEVSYNTYNFHLHFTGQNLVTWIHVATREPGEYSLLPDTLSSQIKLSRL